MTIAPLAPGLLPGTPLTPAAARERRLSWHALNRSGRFLKVVHGLYTPKPALPEAEFAARVAAAVRAAGPTAAACDVTGLRLMGVDLPRRLESEAIHVLVPRRTTAYPQRDGLVVHRQDWAVDTHWAEGIPVAQPEICLAQAAERASLEETVVVGDGLLRRHRPLSSLDRLAGFVGYARRRHGVAAVRAALPLMRAGTDSPRETHSRLLLVYSGLPCPEVNLRVRTADGDRFLDLAYGEARLGFEYDGRGHWRDGGPEADARRRRLLQDLGWELINVTAADLARDPDSVVRSVVLALARRAPHLLAGVAQGGGRALMARIDPW
jgi:hypothetical protein